jgi:regulator of protease activity HflC (stomatin/prohibitin superfamily)
MNGAPTPLFSPKPQTTAPVEDPVSSALGSAFSFVLVGIVILALGWLASGTRLVEPGHQAVVRRFGAVDRVAQAGLLLALPRPFEMVEIIPAPERQLMLDLGQLDVPERTPGKLIPTAIGGDPRTQGGYALTADAGVVHLRGTLVYTVEDPAAFAMQGPTVVPALRRLFQASVVMACAGRPLDGVLVASPDGSDAQRSEAEAVSRERLRADVLRLLNARLHALADHGPAIGVVAHRVDLAAFLPEAARPSFDAVVAAESTAARDIAEARTEATRLDQESQAQANALLSQAKAKAGEQLATARVATDRIRAVMGERDPGQRQLLLTRLYRERLDAVLSRAGATTLVSGDTQTRLLVPGR